MSGALVVVGFGDGVVPHPTRSTAAIVVSRRCFICLQLLILHPSWRCVCEEDWRFLSSRLCLQVRANLLPLRPIEQEGPVRAILKIRFVIGGSHIIDVVIKERHVAPSELIIAMPIAVLKGYVGSPRDFFLPAVSVGGIVVGQDHLRRGENRRHFLAMEPVRSVRISATVVKIAVAECVE